MADSIVIGEFQRFASGDPCPVCGQVMWLYEGEPTTHRGPGVSAGIYCRECKKFYPIDWDRQVARHG